MQYETKIQKNGGGVPGFNEFSLKYDPGTQDEYAEKYGHRVDGQENDVLYHTPDGGSPVPVRVTPRNKFVYLETAIVGSDENAIIASANKLKRLIRESFSGDTNNIRIAITPAGSEYTTFRDILHGYIDDSGAYYEDLGMIARDVVIILECCDGGYGTAISITNELSSSPHFIEDWSTTGLSGDGLADGWNRTGAPTTTIDTSRFLIGGNSQKFVTNATTAIGIYSNTVLAPIGSDIVAKVSLVSDTSDLVSVVLRDGAGTAIAFKDIDNADSGNVHSRSYTGSDGSTWYEVRVSGQNTGAANCYLQIQRSAGNASQVTSVWVDAAYIKVGQTDLPNAWGSSSSIKNRYDPNSTSASTIQRINYLDIWGVPGDMPASINMTITQTAFNADGMIIASLTDGTNLAADWKHWLDSAQLAGTTGTVSTVVDSSRAGGSYLQWSGGSNGSAETQYPAGINYATDNLYWSNFDEWLATTPARVYALARASNASSQLRFSWEGTSEGTNEYADFNTAATWELLDLGLMNATTSGAEAYVIPKILVTNAGGTVDLDAVIFLPVDSNPLYVPFSQGTAAFPYYKIVGSKEYVQHGQSIGLVLGAYVNVPHVGDFQKIEPGPRMTRLYFFMVGNYSSNPQEYNINTSIDITASVTPRVSHLLGVS